MPDMYVKRLLAICFLPKLLECNTFLPIPVTLILSIRFTFLFLTFHCKKAISFCDFRIQLFLLRIMPFVDEAILIECYCSVTSLSTNDARFISSGIVPA